MNQPIATTMTSLEISELTGKTHKHVLRDIRKMVSTFEKAKSDGPKLGHENSPELVWFCVMGFYADARGKVRELYNLDKKTTITLLSGYDVVARHKIITRWEQLEVERTSVSPTGNPQIDQLIVFTERPKQINNSKEVNSYNFQQGGQKQTIDYNRKNCFYHTGRLPHEIVAWAKHHKWPAKKRSSAKEVIRNFKPAMACSMALADDFCKTGKIAIEESATFCKSHALPLFEKMAEFGILSMPTVPQLK